MGMRYVAIAESDIGIVRGTNQDSILIKHATYGNCEILMAIVCDGMGGLSKGEIASATVIHEFDKWFSEKLPLELKNIDMNVIGSKWSLLLKTLNVRILEYGLQIGERLGTTFTGVLFINKQFVVVHVGDTRLYYIGSSLKQLTSDHTFVAREVMKGNLTPEQAETDKRRNMLLQCVGASKTVEPEIICGKVGEGVYVLCSDGFRHKVAENEILEAFDFKSLKNKRIMQKKSRQLIKLIKQREEKDNISVILIRSTSDEKTGKVNSLGIWGKLFHAENKIYLLGMVLLVASVAMLVCGILCM